MAADYQSIVINDEEYPGYLEKVYRNAFKASPEAQKPVILPAGSAAETGAVEQMEAFLLRGLPIGEEDLRLLALTRANAILANLVDSGKVEAGRLFVIEPQLTDPGSEEEPEVRTMVELLIK